MSQPGHRPAEGRRHLINVSRNLQSYCYSKKMVPFISAPSARAHLLLPRQPTRTQQVCKSPALGSVFLAGMLQDVICDFSSGSLCSSQGRPAIGPSGWRVSRTTACHLELEIRNSGLDSFLGRWKGTVRAGETASLVRCLPQA